MMWNFPTRNIQTALTYFLHKLMKPLKAILVVFEYVFCILLRVQCIMYYVCACIRPSVRMYVRPYVRVYVENRRTKGTYKTKQTDEQEDRQTIP